jgi:hypothetical protein
MSDFLSNLVIRSLGAAPVIQPRLPSLFEPSTPYAGSPAATPGGWDEGRREAPAETAFEDVEVAPVHAAVDPFRVSAAPRRDETPASRGAAHERQAPVVEDRNLRAAATRSAEAGTELEAPPPVVDPFLAHKPSREPANRRADPVPTPPALKLPAGDFIAPSALQETVATALNRSTAQPQGPAILRTKSENPERASSELREAKTAAPRESHETTEAHAKSVRVELREAKTAAPRESHETTESRPKSVVRVEPASSRIRDSAPRVTAAIEPPGTPRFEFARPVPPSRVASPPEPTIQVTIGRIEVRAVSPQASTPKERPASPVMSLNDYLRQRSKRGDA